MSAQRFASRMMFEVLTSRKVARMVGIQFSLGSMSVQRFTPGKMCKISHPWIRSAGMSCFNARMFSTNQCGSTSSFISTSDMSIMNGKPKTYVCATDTDYDDGGSDSRNLDMKKSASLLKCVSLKCSLYQNETSSSSKSDMSTLPLISKKEKDTSDDAAEDDDGFKNLVKKSSSRHSLFYLYGIDLRSSQSPPEIYQWLGISHLHEISGFLAAHPRPGYRKSVVAASSSALFVLGSSSNLCEDPLVSDFYKLDVGTQKWFELEKCPLSVNSCNSFAAVVENKIYVFGNYLCFKERPGSSPLAYFDFKSEKWLSVLNVPAGLMNYCTDVVSALAVTRSSDHHQQLLIYSAYNQQLYLYDPVERSWDSYDVDLLEVGFRSELKPLSSIKLILFHRDIIYFLDIKEKRLYAYHLRLKFCLDVDYRLGIAVDKYGGRNFEWHLVALSPQTLCLVWASHAENCKTTSVHFIAFRPCLARSDSRSPLMLCTNVLSHKVVPVPVPFALFNCITLQPSKSAREKDVDRNVLRKWSEKRKENSRQE